MSADVIDVEALSKTYDPSPGWMRMLVRTAIHEPVVALQDVSFSVAPGQIRAIIGPNGAGKSTLFRILTGLTTPTSGSASVVGFDPVTDAHRIRRYVGFMPAEDRTLFLRHSCRENLRFHGRLQGMDEDTLMSRIDEMLETVGLAEARDRVGFALSSGMRARLMLARAVLHQPRVLILDEPTGVVDPLAAHSFLELITKITRENGIATLISSHRLEEIHALRDDVMLLDQGRLIFTGNLDQVEAATKRRAYEAICIDVESADRVAAMLRTRLGPDALIEVDGATVVFPMPAEQRADLGWVTDLGDIVESVSLRKLSLREVIGDLLADGGGK